MTKLINKQKGVRNMRATFIKRRIIAAIALVLFAWGSVNIGQTVVDFLNQPTFICKAGKHTWKQGDKVWDIADVHCQGNITDAARQIMKDNDLAGKDLNSLPFGTVIKINERSN